MHWTCACQQVHYLENSRAAHDAHLLISLAIRVLRPLPATGIKTAPCPATAHHDSPTDSRPVRRKNLSCALSHALSHDGPPVWYPFRSPCRMTGACRSPSGAPLSLPAVSLQASVDVSLAMDMSTPVTPRVHCFPPFASNKDEGDKDARPKDVSQNLGAPQAAPSRQFGLTSGEETKDPVPCGSAVVGTTSDAAWESKAASVYYRRAVRNL